MQFLENIRIVYPLLVEGQQLISLQLKEIDASTVNTENFKNFMPKCSRITTFNKEIEESVEENNEKDLDDSITY